MYLIFITFAINNIYVHNLLSKLLTFMILSLQFLLAVSKRFGDDYLTHIMLPVFFMAVGNDADLAYFPSTSQSKIKGRLFH